jgi:chemotaxis protein histidine kinase CheA
MDELADLIAALARFEERARKPKKRKKVRTTGRPAKTGPSAGCGTGSGGFKAGNNCAKEDGIPQRPLSQGGALKGANAKDDFARAKALKENAAAKKAKKEAADKAKSIATKPQREAAKVERKRAAEKQAKIDELRRAAAERKAQKGERDAAERKAAQEAADRKRSEMLQKIRIKEANKKLDIIEKPAAKFSGEVDGAAAKNAGETQFDFAKRRIDADLKKLHSEIDALEKRADQAEKAINSKIQQLKEDAAAIDRERRENAQKITAGGRKVTKKESEEHAKINERHAEAHENLRKAQVERDKLDAQHRKDVHKVIGEFVESHGKGLVSVDASKKFADEAALNKTRSQYKEEFKTNAGKAWEFLKSTLAPIHQPKIDAIKVKLDTDAGSADYSDITQTARHGTLGGNADYHISRKVIVHEIAHGLHYGRQFMPPEPGLLPKQDRVSESVRAAIKEDYDARVAKLRSDNPQGLEQVVYHPERQSYRLWKPKGEARKGREESYLGYANQYSDSELQGSISATEVVSVGVEHVYDSPRRFRKNSRSHFDLTLLFMAGRLH